MHQSFLRYRRFLFLKVAAAICALAILAYALHAPVAPPNGGTWLGYTLGSIGAGLIGWLAWFGVRKRRYQGTQQRLVRWLSAHVYLGTSLIVIVTLHSGFQFGWNVHTLAYVLTILVIVSGFYGVYAYVNYPARLAANRGALTREVLIHEVAELDREALVLADQVGRDAHTVVLQSIEETVLGGTVLEQLFGDPKRRAAAMGVGHRLEEIRHKLEARIARDSPEIIAIEQHDATAISYLAEHLIAGAGPERLEKISRLFDLIMRKRVLVERIQRDIQIQARLGYWLYWHVPLSVALIAALFAHVFAVFFYW